MARPRDEVESAYFTLLRAREELEQLRRYVELLADEGRRLRRFRAEGAALADMIAPRLRRALRHTDDPLEQAVKARLEVVEDELQRSGERVEAAEEYVAECERRHDELRARN